MTTETIPLTQDQGVGASLRDRAAAATQSNPQAVSSKAGIPSADSKLAKAIEAGRAQGKSALYFGCLGGMGHYLHLPNGSKIWSAERDLEGFPWSDGLMDTGLLKNGKRPDQYDGKVYWTAGGLSFWYAFFWWDRSVDKRGASNSGFYVRGFGWPEAQEAFDYACTMFPKVVARQAHPLILQNPMPAQAIEARRAGTAGSGAQHESAVATPCAQPPSSIATALKGERA